MTAPLPTAQTATTARHVVITGASSGLGAALARLYAGRGCRLTLLGRHRERLEQVAEVCRLSRGRIVDAVACDVTDASAMANALRAADDREPVGVAIANAGIGGSGVVVGEAAESLALARSVVGVNVLGVLHTTTPLIERLVARRSGHIVIVGSLAGRQGLAVSPVYSATKAAVRVYGQGLRRLLAEHGVRVTVVSPGFVATPMSRSLTFRQPFLVTAEDAAQRIARGVDRGAREIVFPWQLRVLAAALDLLPEHVVDRVLAAAVAQTSMHKSASS